MAATKKSLLGYPCPGPNGKTTQIIEIIGPVLYVVGGQQINATDFGFSAFDFVDAGGYSRSGTYYGRVQYLPVDAAPSENKLACPSVMIKWIVAATNAEYGGGDISTEVLRVKMIMV